MIRLFLIDFARQNFFVHVNKPICRYDLSKLWQQRSWLCWHFGWREFRCRHWNAVHKMIKRVVYVSAMPGCQIGRIFDILAIFNSGQFFIRLLFLQKFDKVWHFGHFLEYIWHFFQKGIWSPCCSLRRWMSKVCLHKQWFLFLCDTVRQAAQR
jgi:hypothetical protein